MIAKRWSRKLLKIESNMLYATPNASEAPIKSLSSRGMRLTRSADWFVILETKVKIVIVSFKTTFLLPVAPASKIRFYLINPGCISKIGSESNYTCKKQLV